MDETVIKQDKREDNNASNLHKENSDEHHTNKRIAQQYNVIEEKSEKFPCDECEYVAKYMRNLKQHKKDRHEGVQYPCHKCDYIATRKSSLFRHLKSLHMEVAEFRVTVKEEPEHDHTAGIELSMIINKVSRY